MFRFMYVAILAILESGTGLFKRRGRNSPHPKEWRGESYWPRFAPAHYAIHLAGYSYEVNENVDVIKTKMSGFSFQDNFKIIGAVVYQPHEEPKAEDIAAFNAYWSNKYKRYATFRRNRQLYTRDFTLHFFGHDPQTQTRSFAFWVLVVGGIIIYLITL